VSTTPERCLHALGPLYNMPSLQYLCVCTHTSSVFGCLHCGCKCLANAYALRCRLRWQSFTPPKLHRTKQVVCWLMVSSCSGVVVCSALMFRRCICNGETALTRARWVVSACHVCVGSGGWSRSCRECCR
jgi:hypothetical protein